MDIEDKVRLDCFNRGYEQGKKETAEKFAERLKENTYNLIDFTGLVDTLVVDWISIEEILKEITEDSNE